MNMNYKVSVIVPIYKVEKFIGRCAESLMQQTLDDVEYIFINDATPDNSMEILEEVLNKYPDKTGSVSIVAHEVNKGLPAARNTGLSAAHGEYVFHCDSDDFVEPTMLETLYHAAVNHAADIVWCDWFLSFEKNERYMKQPEFSTSFDALKSMLGGGMKYNVWNKLVKRNLYTDYQILFPAGHGMGEDMTMMMLFAHARNIKYVPQAFYHYVKLNASAFSSTVSDKHWVDLRYNLDRTVDYISRIYGDRLEQEIAFLKLEAKFPFLIMGNSKLFKLWREWYPEANKYILLNKNISFRSRMLQWFAWKGQFWIVRLYDIIISKIIYGIIYK